MKRLVIAAFALVGVFVVAGSALAATGTKASVIYDSTNPNGAPTNLPSYGPEAYSFKTIGNQISFAPGSPRSLTNVTVALSSWACQQGSWYGKDCVTQPGATFSQPITLTIKDSAGHQLASSTQTFNVPYRPSASSKCTGDNAGKWMTPAKECKNGLADDVTFNFSHVQLPDTVQYEISYNTNTHGPNPTGVAGPADSLNVAIAPSTLPAIWIDGTPNADFGNYTPMVQFKAGNGS